MFLKLLIIWAVVFGSIDVSSLNVDLINNAREIPPICPVEPCGDA